MIWVFFIVLAVLLVAAFAALVARRVAYDPMPPPPGTAHAVLPGPIRHAADIDAIHFDTALRGYRMDQVDEVLEALQARLAAYEHPDQPTMKLPRAKPRGGAPDLSAPRPPATRQPPS